MDKSEWTVIHIRRKTKARIDAAKGKDASYDVYLSELHSRIAQERNKRKGSARLKLWP